MIYNDEINNNGKLGKQEMCRGGMKQFNRSGQVSAIVKAKTKRGFTGGVLF